MWKYLANKGGVVRMFEVFWQGGFSKLFFAHHDKTDAVTGPSDYALVFLILNCKTRYVEKLESLF